VHNISRRLQCISLLERTFEVLVDLENQQDFASPTDSLSSSFDLVQWGAVQQHPLDDWRRFHASIYIDFARLLELSEDTYTWLPTTVQQFVTLRDYECIVLLCAYYRIARTLYRSEILDSATTSVPNSVSFPLPLWYWFRPIGTVYFLDGEDEYVIDATCFSWMHFESTITSTYSSAAEFDTVLATYTTCMEGAFPGFRSINLAPQAGTPWLWHGYSDPTRQGPRYPCSGSSINCEPVCFWNSWLRRQSTSVPIDEHYHVGQIDLPLMEAMRHLHLMVRISQRSD